MQVFKLVYSYHFLSSYICMGDVHRFSCSPSGFSEIPEKSGHILGRPLLSFVLIVVFGIYGLVYLGRLHGLVPYRDERIFFVTMNFTTKLFASMTLAGIRSSEFQEVLLTMLANTQTSFKRALNYEDQISLLAD